MFINNDGAVMKKLYLIKLMFIAAIFFATSKALAGSYSVINLINERLSYMKDVAWLRRCDVRFLSENLHSVLRLP